MNNKSTSNLLANAESSSARTLGLNFHTFTNFGKRIISSFFSREPKFYTIPFGPIKGMKIFTSFFISPRMLLGFDETWVAKLVKLHLVEGDTVYDVGAHIGYTSLLFSKFVGTKGKVHAFELLPNVVNQFISKTIKANKLENQIFTHPVGLSNQQGELSIYVGETMMGTLDTDGYETQHIEKCKVVTLDQYFVDNNLTPPKLIKVDIERAEILFLEGAISVIKKYKPLLIIEFHNLDLLKQGYQLLNEMNYQLIAKNGTINNEYLAKITSFHDSILAKPKS